MSNQTPLYQLLAVKLGRDPVEDMTERRNSGQSWRAIERSYLVDYGVSVTDVTLRAWMTAAQPATA